MAYRRYSLCSAGDGMAGKKAPAQNAYANFLSPLSTAVAECPTFLSASESRSFDTPNLSAQY